MATGKKRVDLGRVVINGRHGPMLKAISLSLEQGKAVFVAAEPGHGHLALALAATGRFSPDSGTVLLNGVNDPDQLKRVAALVDVPTVNEPVDVVTVRTTVAEFLAIAGSNASRRSVTNWLEENGFSGHAHTIVENLDPYTRTALMAALAAEDPQVRFLIFSLPDRHGGNPVQWYQLAQDYAARDYGVLVTCNKSTAHILIDQGWLAPADEDAAGAESTGTRPTRQDPMQAGEIEMEILV